MAQQPAAPCYSLPELKMPEIPTGQHIGRATGVSSNFQSPSGNLQQITLTYWQDLLLLQLLPTSDSDSDDYKDSLFEDPNYYD